MARAPRRLLVVVLSIGVAALGGVASSTSGAASSPTALTLLVIRDDGIWLQPASGGAATRLAGTRGAESAAWAPNGRELAFARTGMVYGINADGSGLRTLLRGGDPAWSPDGRRLAAARDGRVIVARRNGRAVRPVTPGPADSDPAWSSDGRRLAFVRNGVVSVLTLANAAVTAVASGRDPEWSPDGSRITFSRETGIASAAPDGTDLRVEASATGDRDPSWAAETGELFVVQQDNTVVATAPGGARRTVAAGTALAARSVPTDRELLPDLDQRAPDRVAVARVGGRYKLAFASAVDNVGRGPLWVRGTRTGTAMDARQLVRTSSGTVERHVDAGLLRYTWSPTHSHWHLVRFVSYELRRAVDHRLVARDRKTGFCLADHYGHARRVRPVAPAFLGNCRRGAPRANWVDQGSSVGYTDRYPPNYHGQNVDLAGVPAGTYVLVHRANPEQLLRERSYTNNVASVRLRLTRAADVPRVTVLRSCEGSERC